LQAHTLALQWHYHIQLFSVGAGAEKHYALSKLLPNGESFYHHAQEILTLESLPSLFLSAKGPKGKWSKPTSKRKALSKAKV
jgi:hypothetical protein